MMIIKTDQKVFNLPFQKGINILIENKFTEEIITCLNSYFGSKKKNLCIAYDENEETIQPKEFEFIHITNKENLQNNYSFKEKTLSNLFLSEFVSDNPLFFESIDKVRNDLDELITDQGMFKMRKIMFDKIGLCPEIITSDFSIPNIVEMLSITDDNLTKPQMMASLYNLLIFKNRDKESIIYIDFELDDSVVKWINNLNSTNAIIIINSSSIVKNLQLESLRVIIPSASENVCEYEISQEGLDKLIYMTKPFVLNNLSMQKEENIRFIANFTDDFTTYLIEVLSS